MRGPYGLNFTVAVHDAIARSRRGDTPYVCNIQVGLSMSERHLRYSPQDVIDGVHISSLTPSQLAHVSCHEWRYIQEHLRLTLSCGSEDRTIFDAPLGQWPIGGALHHSQIEELLSGATLRTPTNFTFTRPAVFSVLGTWLPGPWWEQLGGFAITPLTLDLQVGVSPALRRNS